MQPSAASNCQTVIRPSSRVPLGTIALSADGNVIAAAQSNDSPASPPLSVSMDQNGMKLAGSLAETPTGRRKQTLKRQRMRESWSQ